MNNSKFKHLLPLIPLLTGTFVNIALFLVLGMIYPDYFMTLIFFNGIILITILGVYLAYHNRMPGRYKTSLVLLFHSTIIPVIVFLGSFGTLISQHLSETTLFVLFQLSMLGFWFYFHSKRHHYKRATS